MKQVVKTGNGITTCFFNMNYESMQMKLAIRIINFSCITGVFFEKLISQTQIANIELS